MRGRVVEGLCQSRIDRPSIPIVKELLLKHALTFQISAIAYIPEAFA